MSRNVHIVGAGITGLLSAYFLHKRGFKVRVYEADSHTGGMIQTHDTAFGKVETAANAWIASPGLVALCQELGVDLIPTQQNAKKRWIYSLKRARCFPFPAILHPRVLIPSFVFILRLLIFRRSLAPKKFESIRHWGERVLGEWVCRNVLEPALQGIYAGSGERLSATLVVGRFFGVGPSKDIKPKRSFNGARIQRKNKLFGSVAPLEGMGAFTKRLEDFLKSQGVEFLYRNPIQQRKQLPEGEWVFHAVSNPSIRKAFLEYSQYFDAMTEYERLPVITATLFFEVKQRLPQRGFGILFKRNESIEALGVLQNHEIFQNRAKSSISETWIFGQETAQNMIHLSDREILDLILKDRAQLSRKQIAPKHYRVTKWPEALPYYTVELERCLDQMPEYGIEKNSKTVWVGTELGSLGLTKLLERIEATVDAVSLELVRRGS